MTIVAVGTIPKAKRVSHKDDVVSMLLDEFANSPFRIAKVVLESNDYVNEFSAYSSIYPVVKRQKRPIKVRLVNGEIYLEKII